MNKPGQKTILTQIRSQRAALAKIHAEAEDLEDHLVVLEARVRDIGERIPMATVHRRIGTRHKHIANAIR
jgi:hypothetical protein